MAVIPKTNDVVAERSKTLIEQIQVAVNVLGSRFESRLG